MEDCNSMLFLIIPYSEAFVWKARQRVNSIPLREELFNEFVGVLLAHF